MTLIIAPYLISLWLAANPVEVSLAPVDAAIEDTRAAEEASQAPPQRPAPAPNATLDVFETVDGRPEQKVTRPDAAIDKAVRQVMDEQRLVGAAVGVVRAGRITYLKGYGHADREAERPVDARRTMFRWASIAKSVTAVTATTLMREEVLTLDTPIQQWFPRWRTPGKWLAKCRRGKREIVIDGELLPCTKGYADAKVPRSRRVTTLRQLLSHTAGVMGYGSARGSARPSNKHVNNPKWNTGIKQGLRKLYGMPLLAVPGAEYNYTTFGFNLVGVVMEHATGQTYPELITERVAKPAGLTTLQPDYEWEEIPARAAGYRKHKRKGIVRSRSTDVSWKAPGGGLIGTPEDLARFCGGLMGDTLLTQDEKVLLWSPQMTSDGEPIEYGLGFSVGERDGRRFVEHAGVQQKTRTRFRLYPDEDLCVVVMSNTTTADTGVLVEVIEDAIRL